MNHDLAAALAGLRRLPEERERLRQRELELINTALAHGETLRSLADLYGMTPQALGQRYRALGGKAELKAGRPRTRSLVRDIGVNDETPAEAGVCRFRNATERLNAEHPHPKG